MTKPARVHYHAYDGLNGSNKNVGVCKKIKVETTKDEAKVTCGNCKLFLHLRRKK